MANFCSYCGSPIDQTTQKCTFCGWTSDDVPQPGPNKTQQQEYSQQPFQAGTTYQEPVQETSFVDPAYLDQEKIIYPNDPRFNGTVDPNNQFRTRQVPTVYANVGYESWPQVNKVTAALLAIFLGCFGVHKFYLRNPIGIAYLLCTVFSCGMLGTIPGILGFVEGIAYLCMSDEYFEQKYKARVKK